MMMMTMMMMTMYRMEDTERIRFKLREDRRREVREKAEKEEEVEKMREDRLERNRRWREKKFGSEKLSVEETRDLSEQVSCQAVRAVRAVIT